MKRPSATLIGTFVLGALGLIVAAILSSEAARCLHSASLR